MTESQKLIPAAEARKQSELAQNKAFEGAVNMINSAINSGFEETLLFGFWISLDHVKKLMDMGYSVTTIFHPFEQRKVYKVSWSL